MSETCVSGSMKKQQHSSIRFCRRRAVHVFRASASYFSCFSVNLFSIILHHHNPAARGESLVYSYAVCLPLAFTSIQFHRVACLFFVPHSFTYVRKSKRRYMFIYLRWCLCIDNTSINSQMGTREHSDLKRENTSFEWFLEFTLILISF